VLRYVILEDLRLFFNYLQGLLAKVPVEKKRDTEKEQRREFVRNELEVLQDEYKKRYAAEKNLKEMEEFNDFKASLSNIRQNKPIPLIDDGNLKEYWDYLSKFKKSENREDGLLHFIKDFYEMIKAHNLDRKKQFMEISGQIREQLMTISDELHKQFEKAKEHLIPLPALLDAF